MKHSAIRYYREAMRFHHYASKQLFGIEKSIAYADYRWDFHTIQFLVNSAIQRTIEGA